MAGLELLLVFCKSVLCLFATYLFILFPVQTSSVEIERVCNQAHDGILETAAVGTPPPNGGPELLAVFVVLKEGISADPDLLKMKFSTAMQSKLNPLFKVLPMPLKMQ